MNLNCLNCGQDLSGIVGKIKKTKCWRFLYKNNRNNSNSKHYLCKKCLKQEKDIDIFKKITWRFFISYNGRNYHGWQSQCGLPTIELEIRKALFIITKQNIFLICAGRTDSGVHASGQVVSCSFKSKFNDRTLILALNSVLPDDISVWRADEMHYNFNAKNQNIGKKYLYRIDFSVAKNIFYSDYRWHLRRKLNIEKMLEASKCLIGEHDFESFRSSRCESIHAYRYIWFINIKKYDDFIEFDIRGNAFCHNMVKIIVGTLVDVGSNKLDIEDMLMILKSKNRILAGPTAPSIGLTFAEVYYPDNIKNALLPGNIQFFNYLSVLKNWKDSFNKIKIGQK